MSLDNKYLNCSYPTDFAGDCPDPYLSQKNIIHPDSGKGTAEKVEKRWRQWPHRLVQWYRERLVSRACASCRSDH